jgi:hypothetical protein
MSEASARAYSVKPVVPVLSIIQFSPGSEHIDRKELGPNNVRFVHALSIKR